MPPKQTTLPAIKAKVVNSEGGIDLEDVHKVRFYAMKCNALQIELAERTEEASRAIAEKRELQTRVNQMEQDYKGEKALTFELKRDMTRQYKGMQEDLIMRINSLETTVMNLNEDLADSDGRMERSVREKNNIIAIKDQEILELKIKIENMADEFTDIMKDATDAMRGRMEISFEPISDSSQRPLPMQQRMDEIKLNDV